MTAIECDERGLLFEYVGGEVVEVPSTALGQCLASVIGTAIGRATVGTGRVVNGCRFELPTGNARRAGVAFVSFERWSKSRGVPDTETWDVVPDLVVEIAHPQSPSVAFERSADFVESGTCLVWVVDLRTETVTVFRDGRRTEFEWCRTLDAEPVICGFALSVEELLP